MARNLKNKVVVITGGSVGIGYEIADRYLQKGAKVAILLGTTEARGLESSKNLCTKYGANRAVFMKCNVTKDLDTVYPKIVSTYETVHVLVNNAGILNDQRIRDTININVQALIDWSLKFWQYMRMDKGGKGGTIINLASIYGYRVDQYLPVYQASKFAVMGFTKSLGHTYNYNRSGVRVLGICPGYTDTALVHDLKTWDDDSIAKDYGVFLKKQLWQKVDSVGKAAVDVFENANSGTAWLIEGAKPIVEV
ncbi:15-hydroxyprostaglandin dehydrogenase [NAD(+)]-like [Bicyclus anynana]|uniref:15-hydroxyprostaglandin dehydrogenase [NAD(+)]-like n=1 Tax=Bicyclus anynana TaxID=110368 RepID=A0A6J1NF35_BICAN|nr:15-hydroxyprostaglandin dehydrogenase [NAD(+)]-like [Bicyclus anynana]